MRAAVVLAASLAATPACSERGAARPIEASVNDEVNEEGVADVTPQADADCVPVDDGVRTYAPTFDAVWNEILLHTCATEFCHGGSSDYLHLYSEATGYPALVGAPAEGPDCVMTKLLRVDPFHPETSLMYLKVTSPPCGNRMPFLLGSPFLCPPDVAQIRQWIACGALDGDAGCPAEGGTDADAVDGAAVDAGTDAQSD
jgi:hypothetical protein